MRFCIKPEPEPPTGLEEEWQARISNPTRHASTGGQRAKSQIPHFSCLEVAYRLGRELSKSTSI